MGFLTEIIRAVFMAGAPIGAFTFILVWWALHNGHFEEALSPGKLKKEMAAMVKDRKKTRKKARPPQHPLQKKWASFGGGFYGIVAFFTWIVIELQDIIATIGGFGGLGDFLGQLSVGLVVDMFLEAVFNFVAAIAWPVYWMGSIDSGQLWIWFVAAYAGYWLGLRQAQHVFRQRRGGE